MAHPHVTDNAVTTRTITAKWNKVAIAVTLENGQQTAVKFLAAKKVGTGEIMVGVDIPPTTNLADLKAVIEAAMEKIDETN